MNDKKFLEKKFVGNQVKVGTSKDRYENAVMNDEEIHMEYKGLRDAALFTNKRLIVIDPQGLRGKKVAITSIPWKAVTAYSIENSGTLDFDAELKICGSGFGICQLEFTKGTDLKVINDFLNDKVLG